MPDAAGSTPDTAPRAASPSAAGSTSEGVLDYMVRLDAFHGPLDLLLYLIRKAEVDIIDIPIASIADQYVAHLRGVGDIDVEQAGEFLVMAATLMEIKSRCLVPPGDDEADDAGARRAAAGEALEGLDPTDPRYELVCQLLAYKRFREAAGRLDERREDWSRRHAIRPAAPPSTPSPPPPEAREASDGDDDDDDDAAAGTPSGPQLDTDLEELGVWDLFAAFRRIIEAVDLSRVGDMRVEYDDTPIALHQTDLLEDLRSRPDRRLSLYDIFRGRRRGAMIGLFLAVLELVRQRSIRVVQDRIHDDILVLLEAGADGAGSPSGDGNETAGSVER